MLNSFLRQTYKSKAVTSQFVHKNLKSWKITENQLSKTFVFEDFKNAVAFVNLAENYIDSHKINAQM
jgi:pterin-4a-carbinolamine dehydratase